MRNAFSAFSPRLATALPAAFSKASVAAFCAAIAFTTLAGCETHFTNAGPDGWTGADGVNADGASSDGLNGAAEKLFIGDGVGAKCKTDDTCRGGLACTGGVCMPAGKKLANDACILSADCEKQLQCGFFGFCVPNGGKGVTEVCTSVSDCTKGLYCDLLGVSGFCTAPAKTAKDLYGACKGSGDCLPGLHCGDAKTCLPGSVTLNPDLFPGSTCPVRQEEQLPFQARNRIPRGDESVHGFYSTPFPSNLRLTKAGKVDLSAHPRPGTGLIGLDLVGNVINSIGAEMTGFSVAPGVYFRWTRPLDPKTFYQSGPTQNIHFVELTPGLPPAAYQVDYTTNFQPARNKYICGNWLTVHPTWKRPLKSKTTYAVYVTDTVRAVLPEGAESCGRQSGLGSLRAASSLHRGQQGAGGEDRRRDAVHDPGSDASHAAIRRDREQVGGARHHRRSASLWRQQRCLAVRHAGVCGDAGRQGRQDRPPRLPAASAANRLE